MREHIVRAARTLVPPAALLLAATLTGCGALPSTQGTTSQTTVGGTSGVTVSSDLTLEAVLAGNDDVHVTSGDDWSLADAEDVALSGTAVTTSAQGVSMEAATLRITSAGVYRLTGSLTGGVSVEAADDALVVLVLDGVTIDNTEGPAVTVANADAAVVHLADGSRNSVSDATSYAEDAEAAAAIWSAADLTVDGGGALSVQANGNDGITSRDDLAITSGNVTVTAADDALVGKDALLVTGGELTLTAGGDALKSSQDDDATRGNIRVTGGTISAVAGDDGLQSAGDIVIEGGSVQVAGTDKGLNAAQAAVIADGTVTVTKSDEAIQGNDVLIAGGVVDLTATDDGINGSAGSSGTADTTNAQQGGGPGGGGSADTGERVVIAGGTVTVNAEGDGIDSNGSLTLAGGTIRVFGPTGGGDGIFDANGAFIVTGGDILAVGSTGMPQNPDDASTQLWVTAAATIQAGQEVAVLDADGTVTAQTTSPRQAGMVFWSSPEVTEGGAYTIRVAGAQAATATQGQPGVGMSGGPGGGGPGGGPRG